jgi:hypothetical protein
MLVFDLATFRILFPEFDSVSDAEVTVYLDLADDLSEDEWGDCYAQAALLYSAHLLSLSQIRRAAASTSTDGFVVVPNSSGSMTSATADGLSVGFAIPTVVQNGSDRDAWLNQTPYGQQYSALKRSCLSKGRLNSCGLPNNTLVFPF